MKKIGRYEIVDELGRGAMGVVYRAKDPAIGRTLAVKTIRLSEFTEASELAQLRERLMREAQSAGILSHPGIVTVYDVAEDEANAYIFMEFVDGETLEKLLLSDEPPCREHLLKIFQQTASALDFAHKKGIIHRDIKPANLMVTSEGDAKVTDFGVAKIMSQQMTVTGMVLGTPYYMSPEQVQGHKIDGRSDQFSLGVIAYEILTGQRPYAAESLATLILKIVTETPASAESLNPTLDPSVSQVFEKVFSKSPDDRYPTCTEFVEDLSAALQACETWQPVRKAPPESPPSQRVEQEAETQASAQVSAVAPPVAPPPAPAPPEPTAPVAEPPPTQVSPTPEPVRAADPEPAAAAPVTAAPKKSGRSSSNILPIAAVLIVIAGGVFMVWQFSGGSDGPNTAAVAVDPAPPVVQRDPVAAAPVPEVTEDKPPEPETSEPEEVAPPPVETAPPPPKPAPPRRPAPPAEHEVMVNSTPAGATIVFDNDPSLTCTTPCPFTLPAGRHTMSIRREGSREALRIFNTPEELAITINLEKMAGSLAIQSSPSGATISIDGTVRQEKTPALVSLSVGVHEVVLSLEGFDEYRDTIEIKDRVVANLDVNWR